MELNFNFQGTYIIQAKLRCITGLHIGGSKETFEIGGIDNPVIKAPISIKLPDREIKEGMPYIPGSSLKGKIRSLLEWQYGLVGAKVNSRGEIEHEIKYTTDGSTPADVAVVFGIGATDSKKIPAGPVRVKFFDAYPSEATIKKWEEDLGAGLYTEVKTENAIDRITSAANPRQQERVPAGSEFEVEIVYEVFDDKDHDRLKIVFEGMKRLEDNFLGGGGSRGNGRVKFSDIKVEFKSKEAYTNPSIQPKEEEFRSVDEAINGFEEIKNLANGGSNGAV